MAGTSSHKPDKRTDTIKSHHIEEHRHDPYKARGKLPEPTACPTCGAVFMHGRWQWSKRKLEGAHATTCPACQRIADRFPAGEITLKGAFVAAHSDELAGLIRNVERAEQAEHPLQRIIGMIERDGAMVITTTDVHLPRRIAHAIEAAYKGETETHYDEAGYFVRIGWRRET